MCVCVRVCEGIRSYAYAACTCMLKTQNNTQKITQCITYLVAPMKRYVDSVTTSPRQLLSRIQAAAPGVMG